MAEIQVRMYRRILGDCFLIRTMHDGKPWHALIDFGILQGSSGRAEATAAIVADIAATTGEKIDLLVVTHEHADHISGFAQERARFFGAPGPGVFDIGKVWLAWTENLTDKQAERLHETRRVAGSAVALAAQIAPLALDASATAAATREAAALAGLARFITARDDFGAATDDDPPMPGDDVFGLDIDLKGRFTGARVMAALRLMPNVAYLEPGTRHAAGPFVAHVLGPPRAEKFLAKSDPLGGESREVYLTDGDRARALAAEIGNRIDAMKFGAAADGGPRPATDRESPFALRHRRSIAKAVEDKDPVAIEYLKDECGWRQITGAFLNAASELALQLDNDTNNTSLALALELPDKQVLLFPADAQVGNWLSWDEQRYPKGAPTNVDIANILSRVTVYKVGHHASHNATLRDRGLELMTDKRLSAMIPVDRGVAASQDWAFPFPALERALVEKTGGRMVPDDATPTAAPKREGGRLVLGDGDPVEESAAFAASTHARVTHDPAGLWVEVTIPVAGGAAVLPPAKPRRRQPRKSSAG